MTYQEVLWKNKFIWVVGILSKSGRMHRDLRQYVGHGGLVLGESKGGRLLVQFKGHTRGIPAGCVVQYGTVKAAGSYLRR